MIWSHVSVVVTILMFTYAVYGLCFIPSHKICGLPSTLVYGFGGITAAFVLVVHLIHHLDHK